MSGRLAWIDLTVPDVEPVRRFYEAVVGWTTDGVDMGGYEDLTLLPSDGGDAVGGLCWARGVNADVPASWIPYFEVADLDAALSSVTALGGTLLSDRRASGGWLLVRDPAGAVCALVLPASPAA